jgi:hypothetical protein
MSYLLVSYTVNDYARWRAMFDADTVAQREAGVFVRHALHHEKDDTCIVLIAHIEDRCALLALSRRDEIDDLIKQAGLLRETVKYHWLDEK